MKVPNLSVPKCAACGKVIRMNVVIYRGGTYHEPCLMKPRVSR